MVSTDHLDTLEHEQSHERTRSWVIQLIDVHRDPLSIETQWTIMVDILCPQTAQDRLPEARISWVPDTYLATLSIRCDLPYVLLRWVVIHELVELSWYRSGTVCHTFFMTFAAQPALMASEIASIGMEQYSIARNQEVEDRVAAYLNERRPVPVDGVYLSTPIDPMNGAPPIHRRRPSRGRFIQPPPALLSAPSPSSESVQP